MAFLFHFILLARQFDDRTIKKFGRKLCSQARLSPLKNSLIRSKTSFLIIESPCLEKWKPTNTVCTYLHAVNYLRVTCHKVSCFSNNLQNPLAYLFRGISLDPFGLRPLWAQALALALHKLGASPWWLKLEGLYLGSLITVVKIESIFDSTKKGFGCWLSSLEFNNRNSALPFAVCSKLWRDFVQSLSLVRRWLVKKNFEKMTLANVTNSSCGQQNGWMYCVTGCLVVLFMVTIALQNHFSLPLTVSLNWSTIHPNVFAGSSLYSIIFSRIVSKEST